MKIRQFKTSLIILFLASITHSGITQCFGSFVLENQEAVDTFNNIFPDDCIDLVGSIDIIGPDITNLDGLSLLNSISGYLIIENTALTSLGGLDALSSVDELYMYDNLSLTNIDGLSQLTTISFGGGITSNPLLTSLSGLNNVETIGPPFFDISSNDQLIDIGLSSLTSTGSFNITLNNSLQEINSLSSLTTVDGILVIDRNNNLTSLSGLDNIDPNTILNSDDPRIIIEDNPLLNYCSVQSICDAIEMPGITSTIQDNASGCNSIMEVEVQCSALPISILKRLEVIAINDVHQVTITLTEGLNIDYIEIQQSDTDIDFQTIKTFESSEIEASNYEVVFNNDEINLGDNYYRLKIVNDSGDFEYSTIYRLHSGTYQTEVYPNPVYDVLYVVSNGGALIIYNSLGKTIKESNLSKGGNQINVRELPKGLYFYRVSSGISSSFIKS